MEIPRHWRLKKQRYSLIGEVCPHCDAKIFPPRDICPGKSWGQIEKEDAQSPTHPEVQDLTPRLDQREKLPA